MSDTTQDQPPQGGFSSPNEVKAQPAVLRATVQVIRKDTGKVETYELTGTPEKKEE